MSDANDIIIPADIAAMIEELRAEGLVPAEVLALLERQGEIFSYHISATPDPEALEQAFGFGQLVGSYLDGKKRERKVVQLRQSVTGKLSGKAREVRDWHKPAQELALQIRAGNRLWSQEKIATEILGRWKAKTACPAHSTILAFIRKLEANGVLPKRV